MTVRLRTLPRLPVSGSGFPRLFCDYKRADPPQSFCYPLITFFANTGTMDCTAAATALLL